MNNHYDIAVIGSGPAGQKAAIQARKLGRRVAVIEKSGVVGGTALNTGGIPANALREAVIYLTGLSRRGLFGIDHRVKQNITVDDLVAVASQVITNERALTLDAFERNEVDLVWGKARFLDNHTLDIAGQDGNRPLTAYKIIIASGSRPHRPPGVPFDESCVVCSETLLRLRRIPKSMIVIGGGVVGTEYACMLSALGVRVTLVDRKKHVLGFLDREIVEMFHQAMRDMGVELCLGETVQEITRDAAAHVALASGRRLTADTLLYALGRRGACAELDLSSAGLACDEHEHIRVNGSFQTSVPHIYAVGDVIGFPALASTGMEQGRHAACHACGVDSHFKGDLLPIGIYSIPEISQVGRTEEQLVADSIPFATGTSYYRETAKGQLLGDHGGMLKILVHRSDRTLLGAHVIGSGATELIHVAQAIMTLGGTVDVLVDTVFNFPTLAEAYKTAALRVSNKLATQTT